MAAPVDFSVPTKVLSTGDTLFIFSFIIFLLLLIITIIGVCSESILKMKIFLFFTIVYPKIKMNAVMEFGLGNGENTDFPLHKSHDNC